MTSGTSTDSDLRSDADLIAEARSGDAGAFGVLYGRHAGAALVVARQYSHRASDAEDAVADAFAAVWSALRGGSGPTDAFRAYLFTVVRRVSAVHRTKGRRTEPTDDVAILEAGTLAEPAAEEPALAGFERSLVARAFAALPERWQAVLWHSEVEGKTPAEIGPLLGLTANSTAALAYRAREGLRQAYLQQHLSDDLPDACRAVSGKLGGYVRGGLGARDGAQVEAHLETCGRCRPLVLELQDVNHGLRSVIAPLVLGVAGLGALKFVLPTTGGLAAGTASLASGAAAAGTAGATAGAGTAVGGGTAAAGGAAAGGGTVAGSVAAGTAAAGIGAVGAASAAGATTTGVATGVLGTIGGILASVPTALVAGIAGVVVVAGITVGAVALNGAGDGPAAAGPTSSTTPAGPGSTSSAGTAGPGATSTPTTSAGADPTAQPASTTAPPLADTGSAPGFVVDSPVNQAAPGTGDGPAAPGPTPDPTSSPTATPTATPTPTPTDTPTPPPGAPVLVVSDPAGGLVLVAGQAGQELGIDVANTGTAPATNLVARVDLPAGVVPAGVAQQVAGRFAVHAAASGWSCAVNDTGVGCTLPVLDAGAAVHLGVVVDVDDTFDAPDASVTWQVRGAGLPDVVSHPSRVTVTPAPARLTLVPPSGQVQLLRGHPVTVQVPVRNAGGLPASPAAVTVAAAAGLTITGSADDAWTCSGVGDLTCRLDALAGRTTSTLLLRVVAADDATDGSLGLTLSPVAPGGAATAGLPYRVATPARLSATSSASSLPITAGAPAVTTITVANTGGLAATGVTATLTRPAGAAWAGVASPSGWSCPVPDPSAGGVTCTLASLAAGSTSGFTVTLGPAPAAPADAGALVVTLAAGPDVDVAAPLSVPATVSDLALRFRAAGALDVTQVGAPLLGCDRIDKTHCWNQGRADNNDVAMVPIDLAHAPGQVGRVSSSTALTLPRGVTGSDVAFAGLYWSADKAPGDSWSADLGTARLRGPHGAYTAVTALSSPVVVDGSGRSYYQSFADVTAQVQKLGAGTWSLADVAVADGRTDPHPTYYAGWSLVVVYRSGAAAPSTVSVYDGPAWVAPGSPRDVVIPTGAGASVRIGVVAWDGDRGTPGDCLTLDATALSAGCGVHPHGQANAFDSTATGWGYQNSLGVDAKSFDPVTVWGATSVLTASTTGDQYLLGVVTARVTP